MKLRVVLKNTLHLGEGGVEGIRVGTEHRLVGLHHQVPATADHHVREVVTVVQLVDAGHRLLQRVVWLFQTK
jgi:hypothetical protein